ncbi:hypothetical protein BYT27DRAFT_7264064 [Phlegmacium glaucopus]|nr:hypothetical protein BYT27DRAFT_7264064 [Phlegmacium glaucopus]
MNCFLEQQKPILMHYLKMFRTKGSLDLQSSFSFPFALPPSTGFRAIASHTPPPNFQIENQSLFLSEYGLPRLPSSARSQKKLFCDQLASLLSNSEHESEADVNHTENLSQGKTEDEVAGSIFNIVVETLRISADKAENNVQTTFAELSSAAIDDQQWLSILHPTSNFRWKLLLKLSKTPMHPGPIFVPAEGYCTRHLAFSSSACTRFCGTSVTISTARRRISYRLDVHGPFTVHTSCSSGLIVFDHAVQYPQSGQGESAIIRSKHTYGISVVVIAVYISPESQVVSGEMEAIEKLISAVKADGLQATKLGIHGPSIMPALSALKAWSDEHGASLDALEKPFGATKALGSEKPNMSVLGLPSKILCHHFHFESATRQVQSYLLEASLTPLSTASAEPRVSSGSSIASVRWDALGLEAKPPPAQDEEQDSAETEEQPESSSNSDSPTARDDSPSQLSSPSSINPWLNCQAVPARNLPPGSGSSYCPSPPSFPVPPLLKDENIECDIIADINSAHEIGIFAQLTSVFAVAGRGEDDKEDGLTAVLYPIVE